MVLRGGSGDENEALASRPQDLARPFSRVLPIVTPHYKFQVAGQRKNDFFVALDLFGQPQWLSCTRLIFIFSLPAVFALEKRWSHARKQQSTNNTTLVNYYSLRGMMKVTSILLRRT